MDEIILKTQELKNSLYELEEVKEYLRLKNLYLENTEIKSLELQIKQTPINSKEHKLLLQEYNSHPLVINYLKAKEEVESILKMIKEILEK